jgi:dihydrofolate reductase
VRRRRIGWSLLNHQLIDQLVLKVNPIIVGEGISLFGNVKPRLKLRLVDMKQYSNGVVKPTYNIIYTKDYPGEPLYLINILN